ncbi:TPA_asm: hypothetical protein G0G78_27905 [Salmonella enterica]|nr:hypothetical protein [Salmonella enterica]HAC8240183.1 hypothetical protein [Salmonella enterica]HAC8273723.1 hypothetical protein [Salmonella enterica]
MILQLHSGVFSGSLRFLTGGAHCDFCPFLLLALVLYCPCFTLLSCFGRPEGGSVFTLRNRGQRWRVINLAVRERMGRMDRRRVRFYHHAFVWALNEALQTGALVLFRSHLLWPAQVRLSDLTLGSTCRRHHIVTGPLLSCQAYL